MKKEIEKIINSIPKDLTELETAYFVYLELGKILNANTEYFLTGSISKRNRIFDAGKNINTIRSNNIICNSSAELYSYILNKIGIESSVFYYSTIQHADVFIKDSNDDLYYANLLEDLHNIQTGARTRHFAPHLKYINKFYRDELQEKNYINISYINQVNLEKMDNKLGYTFRGIYLNDFLERIKLEIKNSDFVNSYILPSNININTCSPQDLIKYKFLFLINNLNSYSENATNSIGFLELQKYYDRLYSVIFSTQEKDKINTYYCYPKRCQITNDILSTYISLELDESNIIYFVFSKEQNKFVSLPKETLQKEINNGLIAYKNNFRGIEREY